jgi:hypothetical protein
VRSWHRDWNPNGPPLPQLRQYPAHIEPGQFPPPPNPPLHNNTAALTQTIQAAKGFGGPNPKRAKASSSAASSNAGAAQDSMWALLSVLQRGDGADVNNQLPLTASAADTLAALTDAATQLTDANQQAASATGGVSSALSTQIQPPPVQHGALAAAAAAMQQHVSPPALIGVAPPTSPRRPGLDHLHQMGLLTQIFLRLDPKDLGRVAQACRLLREQAYLDVLWTSLLRKFYFDAPPLLLSDNAGYLSPREVFGRHASPHSLLRRYVLPSPEDACPCGTGEQYYKCCLPQVLPPVRDSTVSEAAGQHPKRDASLWDLNHPKALTRPHAESPPELKDSDATTFTYHKGPLDIGNDVFVADMTINDAIKYCASPTMQHAVGFTFCADVPAPEGIIRCYFKWATRKGTQPPDYHPPGAWHTFIRTSKVETERQQLEAWRAKQIRTLSAYEMRRASDLTFLCDSSCPRHSGPFRGTRCPEPACIVCGGPGQIVDPVHLNRTYPTARSWCGLCNGSLRSPHRPNARCPCVTSRGVKLPLKIVTLSQTRSMQGSLADDTSFSELRETLNEIFELVVHPVNRLEPGSLVNDGVDMVVLSTTMGPGLDEFELAELQSFVSSGGSAILSAFSNHSSEEHWNTHLVGWLGVHSPPRAGTTQRSDYDLLPDKVVAALEECPSAIELLRGPFGVVNRFTNTNETTFELTQPRPVAGSRGGIMLNRCPPEAGAVPADSPATAAVGATASDTSDERGTLAYFPRSEPASSVRKAAASSIAMAKGVDDALEPVPQGLGQVLVVANYHCLGNGEAWHGGHWYTEPHNRALFLNFAASAVAWRSKTAPLTNVAQAGAKPGGAGQPANGNGIGASGVNADRGVAFAASLLSMSAGVGSPQAQQQPQLQQQAQQQPQQQAQQQAQQQPQQQQPQQQQAQQQAQQQPQPPPAAAAAAAADIVGGPDDDEVGTLGAV